MSEKSDEEKFYPTKASFGDVYLLGTNMSSNGAIWQFSNHFSTAQLLWGQGWQLNWGAALLPGTMVRCIDDRQLFRYL